MAGDDQGSDDDYKDPALKNFNRGAFQARFVVGETVKAALIGALIGAVLLGVFAVAAPLLGLAALPGGGLLAGLGISAVATGSVAVPAFVTGALLNGAILGGVAGGALGIAKSAGGASEAADGEEERLITKSQQTDMRRNRMMALEQTRDRQKMALDRQTMQIQGMNPNQALPRKGNDREVMA